MSWRRLLWQAVRWRLRHGVVAWILAAEAFVAFVLAILVIAGGKQGGDAQRPTPRIAARPANVPQRQEGDTTLPGTYQRFARSRKLIALLQGLSEAPAHMAFKYEAVPGTKFERELIIFKVNTTWSKLTKLLHEIEMNDRAAYISHLRVSRETSDRSELVAEVQVALAMTNTTPKGEQAVEAP